MLNNFVKQMSEAEINKLIRAFSKWESDNLIITHGKRESDVESTYGLAYTDSSTLAALWNCNTQAYHKDNENTRFDGITCDNSGNFHALFTVLDSDGNEVEDISIIFE